MLPHPGFETPDAFFQPDVRRAEINDRCPLLGDRQLQLSEKCLQGCGQGRHHSTERERKPTRHLTPVNGYGAVDVVAVSFVWNGRQGSAEFGR